MSQGTNLGTRVTSTLWIAETEPVPSVAGGKSLATRAYCNGTPPTTASVFAHGCIITQLDTATNAKSIYENVGTSASPSWNLLGDVVASEITLAEGNVLVGNSSGVATALNAKTNTQILVGNGTTITSVAMSGDTTMTNAGVVAIGNAKVSGAKMTTTVGYFQVAKDTTNTTPVNVFGATVPFACTITGVYVISKDTTAGNITVADTAGTVATIAKGTSAGVMVGATSLANTSVSAGNTLTIVSSSAGEATVFITFTVA